MKTLLISFVGVAFALSCGADDSEGQMRHRRAVRRSLTNEATRATALEAALNDADPMVRRYAAFVKTGRDPDRAGTVRKLHRTNVPLSQDPSNDHEVSSILRVHPQKGVFKLPAKPQGADGVELWFAPLPAADADLQVWLNGIYLGQFQRSGAGDGQEFRLNAAAEVVWSGDNRLVVRDGQGAEVVRSFTVEVVRCGH